MKSSVRDIITAASGRRLICPYLNLRLPHHHTTFSTSRYIKSIQYHVPAKCSEEVISIPYVAPPRLDVSLRGTCSTSSTFVIPHTSIGNEGLRPETMFTGSEQVGEERKTKLCDRPRDRKKERKYISYRRMPMPRKLNSALVRFCSSCSSSGKR